MPEFVTGVILSSCRPSSTGQQVSPRYRAYFVFGAGNVLEDHPARKNEKEMLTNVRQDGEGAAVIKTYKQKHNPEVSNDLCYMECSSKYVSGIACGERFFPISAKVRCVKTVFLGFY